MSLATYIKQDLRSRLGQGADPPAELTLESLAEHYSVSFTPVRVAVAELVAEGVLKKGPNRRLSAVRDNANHASQSAATPPRPPRDLLKQVENDLVQLSLRGEARYLREEAAAQQYGVSRSAMRNILHRLAGAGLITHMPRRGWQIRPFRLEDMRAFLDIREVLELKALDLAQSRLVPEQLQAILNGNQLPTALDQSPTVDNSLHAYLVERAGNPYIADFFSRQGRYYEILFAWEDQDRETAIETARQHRQIIEALLRHDWPTARSALSWHIRCYHPLLEKIVPPAPADLA